MLKSLVDVAVVVLVEWISEVVVIDNIDAMGIDEIDKMDLYWSSFSFVMMPPTHPASDDCCCCCCCCCDCDDIESSRVHDVVQNHSE